MDDVIREALHLPLPERLRLLRLLSESIEAAWLVEDEEGDRLDPLSPAEEAALNELASRAALEPSRPLEDIVAELGL
ncbi:MAG: hypothetical protein RIT28_4132 [Pseudomonadota bacterium]|jgi:Arc/MetJ-type ribon-helix-helix transcriptional regulator